MKLLEKARLTVNKTVRNEDGILAYGVAWMLGVPLTVLVIIYLIFGR
jgi:hypothetical protein